MTENPDISIEQFISFAEELKERVSVLEAENEEIQKYKNSTLLSISTEVVSAMIQREGIPWDTDGGLDRDGLEKQLEVAKEYAMTLCAAIYGAVNIKMSVDLVPLEKSQALVDVVQERAAQDVQWGGPEHDDEHQPWEWVGFIEKHLKRANSCNNSLETYRAEMVKIAAVAIAQVESLDRTGTFLRRTEKK